MKYIYAYIVENSAISIDGKALRCLRCVDNYGDECAANVEDTPEAASLMPGEMCWWQPSVIYARNDTLKLKKVGFSFNPSPPR